ncbi:hypothetical protein GCM10010392_28650 [Streptomyces clavifer]|nr:hypothetical protein GCM10010392_28650 [Streptomyces clavifer]
MVLLLPADGALVAGTVVLAVDGHPRAAGSVPESSSAMALQQDPARCTGAHRYHAVRGTRWFDRERQLSPVSPISVLLGSVSAGADASVRVSSPRS